MKLSLIIGLFMCGMAYANDQVWESWDGPIKHSRWYCVSEAPGGMQSSGTVGYGHGAKKKDARRRAIEDCGRSGGWQCAEPQCFPE